MPVRTYPSRTLLCFYHSRYGAHVSLAHATMLLPLTLLCARISQSPTGTTWAVPMCSACKARRSGGRRSRRLCRHMRKVFAKSTCEKYMRKKQVRKVTNIQFAGAESGARPGQNINAPSAAFRSCARAAFGCQFPAGVGAEKEPCSR